MKKIFLAFCLTAISALAAFAQSTSDYRKAELFVGYSNGQVDTGANSQNGNQFQNFFDDRETFHGFNTSAVYNVSRYVGIKADVSGTYNSSDFSIPVTVGTTTSNVTLKTRSSLYNFLGGVQIKDNANEGRFKPFAHALVGAGHGRTKVSNVVCPTGLDCTGIEGTNSETALAGAFGGGIDIRLNNRVDFRAIQVDYNPIKFDDATQHNVRFGIGFVFK